MEMRILGWIGYFYIFLIIAWILFNIIYAKMAPLDIQDGGNMAKQGISYYSEHRGLIGYDHGSKALSMLLIISFPIFLYERFKRSREFSYLNMMALIAGTLSFFINAVSLMLQAATVEYAFKIYGLSDDSSVQSFATSLYDWAMLQGGLSVSLYIVANLLLSVWVMIHSYALKTFNGYHKIGMLGMFFGVIQIAETLASWAFLMAGKQNLHTVDEIVNFIFLIWLFVISTLLLQKKLDV